MLDSLKVSTRLLLAFGGAALMVAAIAALAAVQMLTLARQLGTPEALEAGRHSAGLIATLAGMGSAGGVVVAVWLARSFARALGAEPHQLAGHARRVANGDLSPPDIAASHGVMSDLERMRAQLVELVSAVQAQAAAVARASGQIARGSAEIGQRTESQAAELGVAALHVQALADAVRHNAGHAQRASTQAHEARMAADEGRTEIEGVGRAMQAIADGAARIDSIAGLIDELATQTGVLALNASAASTRAGAAGREFAVVAREVRALAQRCAVATAEVKGLVAASAGQARDGEAQVRRTREAMLRIVQAVGSAADGAQVIGRDSQARGAEVTELSAALSALDERARRDASLIGANGAAAQALDRQAARLLEAVAAFRLPSEEPAGAMLSNQRREDHDSAAHPTGRRPVQPGRR